MRKISNFLFLASLVPLLLITCSYTSNVSYRDDLRGNEGRFIQDQNAFQGATYTAPTYNTPTTTPAYNYSPPPPAYPAYTAPAYTQPGYAPFQGYPSSAYGYPTYQYSAFPGEREQDSIFRANQNR